MKIDLNMDEKIKEIIESHFSDRDNLLLNMLNPQFVSCNSEKKQVSIRYKCDKWCLNTGGTMHGGILCTAMDSGFGMLAHYLSGQEVTTIDINVRFLRPVFLGDDVIITTRAISQGRTIISLTAEAVTHKGIVAAGSAAFMVTGGIQ